jgi:hypothetical protein
MANTKKIRTEITDAEKTKLDQQLKQLVEQLSQRLDQYEKINGKPYHTTLKEGVDYDYVNPQHYVQEDGRQTWEHMIDEFGEYETAIFCKLNAYKYTDRMGKKPNEDIEREKKKIQWYEDKARELFERIERFNDEKIWHEDDLNDE